MKQKLLKKQKVFCIGWHKTGTTTMGEALLILGYRVVGARLDMGKHLLENRLGIVLKEAEQFDAFQDMPWAALYKELDEKFPNSKFILTTRDEGKWLNSAYKHFGNSETTLREWLYGISSLDGNENVYLERYRRHYTEVLEYFENRPQDLLVMSWEDGDGWGKLCAFLELPAPRRKFPHANKGRHNYSSKDKIIALLRSIVPMSLRRIYVRIMERLGLHPGRNRFNNYHQHKVLKDRKN